MAAGDTKLQYATSTAMTITLASLATGSARESDAVDNTSNKYLDALVYLAIPLQTGSPGSDKLINVYVYGSEDGTNYTDNATGSNAALTLRSPTNLKQVEAIFTPDSGALTYKSNPISIAKAFGGVLPRKWGIVVENRTNLTFNATEGNLIKTYTGVYPNTAAS